MGKYVIATRTINKYKRELRPIFEEVEGKKGELIEYYIDQVAFMLAQLDELQETIKIEGSTELFEQGSQRFHREHPACSTHRKVMSNLLKFLTKMRKELPEDVAEEQGNKLDEFLKNKKLKAVK